MNDETKESKEKAGSGKRRRRLAVAVAIVLAVLAAIVTVTVVTRTPPAPVHPVHTTQPRPPKVKPPVPPVPAHKVTQTRKQQKTTRVAATCTKSGSVTTTTYDATRAGKRVGAHTTWQSWGPWVKVGSATRSLPALSCPKPKVHPKQPPTITLSASPVRLRVGRGTRLRITVHGASAGARVRVTASGGRQPSIPILVVGSSGTASELYADPHAGQVRFSATLIGGPTARASAVWTAPPPPPPPPVPAHKVTQTRKRQAVTRVAATCTQPGSVTTTTYDATRAGKRVGAHTTWQSWGPWVKVGSATRSLPALSCPKPKVHPKAKPTITLSASPSHVRAGDPTVLTISVTHAGAGAQVRLSAVGGPQPSLPNLAVSGTASESYTDPKAGKVRFTATLVGGPSAKVAAVWTTPPPPSPPKAASFTVSIQAPKTLPITLLNSQLQPAGTAQTEATVAVAILEAGRNVFGTPQQPGTVTISAPGLSVIGVQTSAGTITPGTPALGMTFTGNGASLTFAGAGYSGGDQPGDALVVYGTRPGTYVVTATVDGHTATTHITVEPPACAPGDPIAVLAPPGMGATGEFIESMFQPGWPLKWPGPQTIDLTAGSPDVVQVALPCVELPGSSVGEFTSVSVGPGLVANGARVVSTVPAGAVNGSTAESGQIEVSLLGTVVGHSSVTVSANGHTIMVPVVVSPAVTSGEISSGEIHFLNTYWVTSLLPESGAGLLPVTAVGNRFLVAFTAPANEPITWNGVYSVVPMTGGSKAHPTKTPGTRSNAVAIIKSASMTSQSGVAWVEVTVSDPSVLASLHILCHVGTATYLLAI